MEMERMGQKSGAISLHTARIMMLAGVVLYGIGLWNIFPTLSDRGYYVALLVLGLFPVAVYWHLVQHQCLSAVMNSWCRLTLLTAMGLLVVGLWNEPIPWQLKLMYVISWAMSLTGMAFYCRASGSVKS